MHACMHIHTSIYAYILITACGSLKHQHVWEAEPGVPDE